MGKQFIGRYNRSIDNKFRLQLPPKIVEEGENDFILSCGLDGCLSVYPRSSFDKLVEKMNDFDYLDDKKRAFIRLTSGSALPVSLDSHGRISIGKDVAEQFSLSSQVTIIGVLDHFEIWNPTLYSKYIASSSLAGFGKGL